MKVKIYIKYFTNLQEFLKSRKNLKSISEKWQIANNQQLFWNFIKLSTEAFNNPCTELSSFK